MSQPQNRYKADLRELEFLLFEQFKMGDLLWARSRSRPGAPTK
jgi:hypothetical protein